MYICAIFIYERGVERERGTVSYDEGGREGEGARAAFSETAAGGGYIAGARKISFSRHFYSQLRKRDRGSGSLVS